MSSLGDKRGEAHNHECMSCGESWECPIPAHCLAGAQVMPSIVLKGPKGAQVFDHVCQRKPASAPSHVAAPKDGRDRRVRNVGHNPERRVVNGSARDAAQTSSTRRSALAEELETLSSKAAKGPWKACERGAEAPYLYGATKVRNDVPLPEGELLGSWFWKGHENTPEATAQCEDEAYSSLELIALLRNNLPEIVAALRSVAVSATLTPTDTTHLLDLLRDVYQHLSATDDTGFADIDANWRAEAAEAVEEAIIGLEAGAATDGRADG